jgi:hypothetical protein
MVLKGNGKTQGPKKRPRWDPSTPDVANDVAHIFFAPAALNRPILTHIGLLNGVPNMGSTIY